MGISTKDFKTKCIVCCNNKYDYYEHNFYCKLNECMPKLDHGKLDEEIEWQERYGRKCNVDINFFSDNTHEKWNELKKTRTRINMNKIKTGKATKGQLDAANYEAQIKLGETFTRQLTKALLKKIKIPIYLRPYKRFIEIGVQLLVSNAGLIFAESVGLTDKRILFTLAAAQKAGTRQLFDLIDASEITTFLGGVIDEKLYNSAMTEE